MNQTTIAPKNIGQFIHKEIDKRLGATSIDIKEISDQLFSEIAENESLLKQLGKESLRRKIENCLRRYQAKAYAFSGLQGDLFLDQIQTYYAIDDTKWRRVDKLICTDYKIVLARFQVQFEGLKAHRDQLKDLYDRCFPLWKNNPNMTVGECLKLISS